MTDSYYRPQRIRLSRRSGWRKPERAVVVARPTQWGNPFVGERAVTAFLDWLTTEGTYDVRLDDTLGMAFIPEWDRPANLRALLPTLRGRDLACWCPLDQPCHADVLLQIANGMTKEPHPPRTAT